jgi:PBP1b-binding outer membrane lipoprotein LpoB
MRRSLVVAAAALVLSACSKPETPAADSPTADSPAAAAAPPNLTDADVGGTWDVEGRPMDRDTVVVRFTMNNTDTGDGTWITFPSGEKAQNTSRQISGDSVVSTTGPFKSQVRKGAQVASTRMVLRRQGDRLVGVATTKYADGDTASFRLTATKKP